MKKIKPVQQFRAPFGPDKVFSEAKDSVFIFGSNLAGVHGGGAAAVSYKKYGAVWGQGFGFAQGPIASSYAVPTKDYRLRTLRYTEVAYWIDQLKIWVDANDRYFGEIFVTKIGCGLAGFTEETVAPLFRRYYWPSNVVLPTGWEK